MSKVSYLWRAGVIFLIGFIIGMFITIEFMVPPSTVITVGKIKIKGDNNQATELVKINPDTPKEEKKRIHKWRRKK